MLENLSKTLRHTALAVFLTLPMQGALAAVTLPGGDAFLNGAFDEINYGATGLAYVSPFLYVSDLNTTDTPATQAGATNLDYDYQVAGLGTPMMRIDYTITNNDPLPFDDLRFIVNVQADGAGTLEMYNDTVALVPNPWGAKGAGDPDQFQVADFTLEPPLIGDIQTNNGLTGANSCGVGTCDVDMALQWNVASLLPGEIWNIAVGLSDDGTVLSGRALQATSVDTLDTVLTFSGNSQVVPLPAAWGFMVLGLGLLGLVRRRQG